MNGLTGHRGSVGVCVTVARRVFITAAEVSGDKHAAQLIRSLRELDPQIEIEGIGGSEMASAGAKIHFETVGNAAMGIRGALRAVEVYKLLRWTKNHLDQWKPDVLVGVDSPSMNFHFAKIANARKIPVLQYVAPQLWAWREGRMKKVRRWIDRLACILPFEENYFRRHGVKATFVGHPLFDELPPYREITGPRFPDRPPVIGLLPGSRKSEAVANFGRMIEVARLIRTEFPEATFLTPTTAATHPIVDNVMKSLRNENVLGDVVKFIRRGTPVGNGKVADGNPPQTLNSTEALPQRSFVYGQDSFDELVPHCDLCVTVSGTATLHVAGFGVPMIVVYQSHKLLWNLVGRWLIRTRTFALVNLLADPNPTDPDPGRHIVPEFVPWFGPVEPVAQKMIDYLKNPAKLLSQRRALARLVGTLDHPGASMNVAKLAVEMMDGESEQSPRADTESNSAFQPTV